MLAGLRGSPVDQQVRHERLQARSIDSRYRLPARNHRKFAKQVDPQVIGHDLQSREQGRRFPVTWLRLVTRLHLVA